MTSYVRNIQIMNINGHLRAVIFDVDGTLFDTLPSLSAAANSVLVRAGLNEIPTPLLRTSLNEGLRSLFRKALALQATPVNPELADQLENEYLKQYMTLGLMTAPLYSHVRDALTTLCTLDVKLGICTNRDRASTEALLAGAQLTRVFDIIVGMGDAPHPKPAADPLLRVLEQMDVSAAEALFVGDSYMDACCARLSQVSFAAHLGGYAGKPEDLLPHILSFTGYDAFTSWVLSRQSSTTRACHV